MHRHLIVALLCLLPSCGIVDPERREIGILDDPGGESAVDVPAEALAGGQIAVTIRTGWPDGCARRGEVEARWDDSHSVTLTPFDYVDTGATCTQSPVRFTHTALVRFDEPGAGTIIVRGRSGVEGEMILVERVVAVERAARTGLALREDARAFPPLSPDR